MREGEWKLSSKIKRFWAYPTHPNNLFVYLKREREREKEEKTKHKNDSVAIVPNERKPLESRWRTIHNSSHRFGFAELMIPA
ncbi:hypothetical protein RJT34_28197 [Clitoria ternatea]|uniref:Uncharacterized protein n=1 Tax=Clitoria ternatea TaxID=43366 RepID=A0AAN9FHC8_CLITE